MTAIIQYNAGNIESVANALQRLGCSYIVTEKPEEIRAAGKVILPGVGEAGSAMHYLKERALDQVILSLTQPVLGICLGMQLLCRHSEESDTIGLGIFDTVVKRFPTAGAPVPHMGWNNLDHAKGILFEGTSGREDVYFVHSYYAELCSGTAAACTYMLPFSAALSCHNFYALQFHPEKSAAAGERILQNFLSL